MKVKELITSLSEYNQSADITLTTSESIFISYIDDNGRYNKKNTPIVFIEGCDEEYLECTSEYINESEDLLWCEHYDKPCKDKYNCDYFEEFINPY